MSRLVTGAGYVESISRHRSDRHARAAFQSLALRLVAPGALLFDFGAGPGTDAKCYARHGVRVGAYDPDPQMCAYFGAACRAEIEAGLVALHAGPYEEFLAADSLRYGRDVALVTANFAPLNLIADLGPLFRRLHAMTAVDGRVLASVLSPWFIGDLGYGWWWRNLGRLRREGCFEVVGRHATIVRRSPACFAAQAAPYFTLAGVWPARRHVRVPAPAEPATVRTGRRWQMLLATRRFMFLLFEKSR